MSNNNQCKPRYNILIVSDFFYPRLGGVEQHQYQLSQSLIQRGHKVVVLTGTYNIEQRSNIHNTDKQQQYNTFNNITYNSNNVRQGIRYLSNGLKVYHIPVISIHQQATIPTLFNYYKLLRNIIIRENIHIIHGHQATSSLMHEAIFHGNILNIHTVYTDHSLFGLNHVGAIHLNKLLQFTLCNISHTIAVSYCDKQNLCYRTNIKPHNVSVIPNAVDSTCFTPATIDTQYDNNNNNNNNNTITVVIISRLVYRKGADLIADVIPQICMKHSNVNFIIGGDGNKTILIEQIREKYNLYDRITLLGNVPHNQVRNTLLRGNIFLNCSLTESFCIALLEAVSCGLLCVSTRVGGVPEILPPQYLRFAQPDVYDIVNVLSDTISNYNKLKLDPWDTHCNVAKMYNWHTIAERTEKVYDMIIKQKHKTHYDRIINYNQCGYLSSFLFNMIYVLAIILHWLYDIIYPRQQVELAVDYNID